MYVDVEALARQRLLDSGLDVPVATKVPKPRPERFIRLVISSNPLITIVHRDTRLTIECWSNISEADASNLAEQVYEIVDTWDEVPVFNGWPSTPIPQPTKTGIPRYNMTCIMRIRMED